MDNSSNPSMTIDPNFIPREDFAPGRMKHSSYTRAAISNAISDHMKRTEAEYTPIQQRGLARLRLEGDWNIANLESMEDLYKWFDIFNSVLFNGVLTGVCCLEWGDSYKSRPGLHDKSSACYGVWPGFECDPRYAVERPCITIVLYTWPKEFSLKTFLHIIDTYLGTLLQRMLQAVFLYYQVCPHQGFHWSGPMQAIKDNPLEEHDIHFISALNAIQPLDDDLMWERSPRGILAGLRFEMWLEVKGWIATAVLSGADFPSPVELTRMGINNRDLLRKIESQREKLSDAESYDAYVKLAEDTEQSSARLNRCQPFPLIDIP